MKKNIVCLVLCFTLLFLMFIPFFSFAGSSTHSRVINVVYDDSGSMFSNDGALVDRWCQAKYSMEVFASMLGDTDKMNVYYMSDYNKDISAKPRIILDGHDGGKLNVEKIHNQKTFAGNTPFNAVKKAYSDLNSKKADEKWLVILTDGEFQGVNGREGIDAYFASKSKDINIMFLGMGDDAAGITENQSENIFYVHAQSSNQILKEITKICTRIFNSNKLEINVSSKSFSFDVPMSELIVFAQGANVSINGIKKEDGTLIKNTSQPVEVKYSECDATNYSNTPNKDLLGKIVTFKDNFEVGKYSVEVSGADTIEVYYKPNVDISAVINSPDGKEITLDNIEAGTYEIEFFLVDKNTNKRLSESKLLGKVEYTATLKNADNIQENIKSGDKVEIKEGDLKIDVVATYLDYHKVETQLNRSIYKNKEISFKEISNPTFEVSKDKINTDNGVVQLQVLIDGQAFSEAQWNDFDLPEINTVNETSAKLGEYKVEKSDKIGIINITPTLENGVTSYGVYDECDITVTSNCKVGEETWSGCADIKVKFDDTRDIFQKYGDKIKRGIIIGVIFIILLGYIPPFKKRLPKNLKKRPQVVSKSSNFRIGTTYENGKITKSTKDKIYSFLPYFRDRAKIAYYPLGAGVETPALYVVASGSHRMRILNHSAFKDSPVSINGMPVSAKKDYGPGMVIEYKSSKIKYTCIPNVKN